MIVADGYGPSSLFSKQPPHLTVECKCLFDKVYYLDFFNKRLTEIVLNRNLTDNAPTSMESA